MSARDFALLSDLIQDVQAVIDQPADDPSQLAFPTAQQARAANAAQEECFRLASSLDADWTTKETVLTVAAGAQFTILPADLRAVRRTARWQPTTNRSLGDLACGEWSQLGNRQYDCLFKPKDTEHANQATLRWLLPTPTTMFVKVVYDYFPVRIAHGCLPEDAGGITMRLAAWEPRETGVLVAQDIYVVQDSRGGAYGNQPIVTWDGEFQTATFANVWSPIPLKGAIYTSRPDLPRDWEQLFVFEMAARLGAKLSESIKKDWQEEKERLKVVGQNQAITMDRRAAKIVRGRSVAGVGFTGDPINRPFGW